jgi:PAS domain S-box-containing protein
MLPSFKSWIKATVYKNPKAIGWISFMVILALTMSISYAEYQLRLANDQDEVNSKLIEIERRFNTALNNGTAATKILSFLATNYNVKDNFEKVGSEILLNSPYVDVIQLLDSGEIIAVFPKTGNEAVLGYDILNDPKTKKEAEEAIIRKEIFFAGPFDLKQGGKGIVGRLPLFKEGQFSGYSAVIIYLQTLLEAGNIENSEKNPFFIQLSKINPNSEIKENFLPEPSDLNEFSQVKASTFLGSGKWYITVQLKKSTAIWKSIPVALLRILLSFGLGVAAWSFSRQPSLLAQKVKEQSKTILESNERFEYATKATSDVIWDWDLINNQVYRSDLFLQKFGYINSTESNKAGFWPSIIHPDDLEQVNQNMESLIASQETYWEQEFRIRKSDEKYVYVRDKGYIIRNQENKALRMIGATEDITKRKLSELELAKEKEKLENVIRGTKAGTWEWNVKTGETTYSEIWANIIGYELSELQPADFNTWKSMVNPQDLGKTLQALESHFEGKKEFYESEYRMRHKDGSCVWILDRGKVSSWTEDGKPKMMFGTHMNITEKKAQEELVLIANQKLTNANEELQIFATLASHDMREPLRMISSFMSLLEKKYGGTLDPKANQYIHFAKDGAQRLTFLINDLLEYSKIGFDEENAEFIETKKLIEEIIPLKHRLIYEKNAKIILGNLPDITAVKTPIGTLFRNLIGNALLFTREGVNPVIRIEGTETEEFWEFSVEDNGIGIEPTNLSYIFGILNKVTLQDNYKRTGMGLATSKKIVNQHGGNIWAHSIPSEGSKFYFTLKKI